MLPDDDRQRSTLEDRVRAIAYRLWQDEGCPAGRELAHWDTACAQVAEQVAAEDSQDAGKPPQVP